MKYVVRKLETAEDDALKAAAWYDSQQSDLGDEFLDEADAVIASLTDEALLYSIRFLDVRCVRLSRFKKYGAFYIIRDDEVRVIAILHGARNPREVRERRRKLA